MIISVMNQKGGVAKTTSVFTLGNILADKGYKTLMVDFDPQISLTVGCGYRQNMQNMLSMQSMQSMLTMRDVVLKSAKLNEIILTKICEKDNLFLAPASPLLSNAELLLAGEYAREYILKNALKTINHEYDYILIDCPPSLGLLVVNALAAADKILIPVAADFIAYNGFELMLDTIKKIKQAINPELKELGVIVTLYDKRTLHCREILAELACGHNVITSIPCSTQVRDAWLAAKSIADYNKNHEIAAAYQEVAEVIINADR